ncbi:MAG: 1-acyl-sn-glycerol-3-phosphate acyltransferase [Flavobacteriales bacterium]|nr:1-acyl-sn-glycerol-3-phosphate acyltransferase [Flavobacteriales bacterium]
MLYSFFKILTTHALKVYFRKRHIQGLENIPKNGPFLIVANHPSSFLDPLCIAVLVEQKISFLAKATMFNNKIIAKILKRFNMVPIYRAQDNPNKLSENQEVFKACYERLSNNGVIMIFPEGTSESERRLRKIKTGAARIALGTAKENNYNLNIKIVPVGLNYTKSSRFRSELYIQFGKPLETKNYIENYKTEEVSTAKKLTADIEENIKNLIIDIENDEYEVLVERIESLYKSQLLKNNSGTFASVEISKGIYEAIQHYQKADAILFNKMKTKIDDYFLNLKELNISDRTLQKGSQLRNLGQYFLKSILILILGFPLWLFGYVNSFIPFKLPRTLALKITDSEAFYGALLMSIGTFSFILFYSLTTYLVWSFSESTILTLCYGIALPLSGFFTIFYARIARRFYYNWQFTSKFFSKQKVLVQLMADRNIILKELESMAKKMNQH